MKNFPPRIFLSIHAINFLYSFHSYFPDLLDSGCICSCIFSKMSNSLYFSLESNKRNLFGRLYSKNSVSLLIITVRKILHGDFCAQQSSFSPIMRIYIYTSHFTSERGEYVCYIRDGIKKEHAKRYAR